MSLRNKLTLDQLLALDSPQLKEAWRSLFTTDPPKRMTRDLLVRLLAQGMQEQGTLRLPKSTEHYLQSIASSNAPLGAATPSKPRRGTRLVRGWGGASHEVLITDRGYIYRGTTYRSLSQIARRITGARWSGPRFFGLAVRARLEKDIA